MPPPAMLAPGPHRSTTHWHIIISDKGVIP